MDKFCSQLGGCTVSFVCFMIPALAVLLGIVGLITCRETKARERAVWLTIGGAILFVLSMLIMAALLSSGRR